MCASVAGGREAAWTALADRAQRSEELRVAEAVRKQEEGLKS